MAYDGNTDRVILFGGDAGYFANDTWSWDGTTWTKLEPATSPPPRYDTAMAYDSRRKRVVLFGGGITNGLANDTWEWDGTTWTQINTPTIPHVRYNHSMAFDPYRGVIVMAGGYLTNLDSMGNSTGVDPPDTWEYDGVDWRLVPNANTPMTDTMAFDPVNHVMVTYSQFYTPPGTLTGRSTYTYNGAVWTDTGNSTPGSTLINPRMATDPRGAAVLFGGLVVTRTGSFPNYVCTNTYKTETWKWNGAAWTTSPASSPSARNFAAAALDPDRHRVVMVGGRDATTAQYLNETWELDGIGWKSYAPPWPAGTERNAASLVYDLRRKQLVLFGGVNGNGATNDTFVRDGTVWTQKFPSMPPAVRDGQMMVYDAERGQTILFGGYDAILNQGLDDTWAWDGTAWTELQPAHSPPPRVYGSIGYDAVRQRVVLFGGILQGTVKDDTWIWDGSDWTEVTLTDRPPPRRFGTMAWDPARRRLVLAGGTASQQAFADAWEWDGSKWVDTQASPRPTPHTQHVSVPTLDGSGIYIMGGRAGAPGGPLDTWRLRWETTGLYEYCARPVDIDADLLVGCADPDCWATCTPLCPPGVACDPAAPRCGDQMCNAIVEDCHSCPQDCATCASAVCGDTFCDAGESSTSCRGDCP
jgi:hypothetical protein